MGPLLDEVQIPQSHDDLFFLFQWLFQQVQINLSELRNHELVKWLNFRILNKNPDLLKFLTIKHKVEGTAQEIADQTVKLL